MTAARQPLLHRCRRCGAVSRFTPAVIGWAWVCDNCPAWGVLDAREDRAYANRRADTPTPTTEEHR